MASIAYLSIGSNLGDRSKICRDAIEKLHKHPQISLLRVSSFYETEPIDDTNQPWFLNAAITLSTSLSPQSLLSVLLSIEKDFGRIRMSQRPKGPRTLDLDLLFFDDQMISTPTLILPHPRLHLRRFVLLPLSEIAPDLKHPRLCQTILELLNDLSDQSHVYFRGAISCPHEG